MNEVVFLLIITQLCFGGLAILFSFREERTKKKVLEQNIELSRRFYELFVLKSLQQELGYSLNIKKMAKTIVSSVGDFFSFSTVSYAIIEEETISVKTYVKEAIGQEFLEEIDNSIRQAMNEIDDKTRFMQIHKEVFGLVSNESKVVPYSYFNVPLVAHNRFLGIITIASQTKNAYEEADMTILYRLVNQAEKALEKVENVIETEKGKLNSMFTNLPNGAIVFLIQEGLLRLSFINSAAKHFLHLDSEANTISVISSLGLSFDLMKELNSMLKDKKNRVFDDINLYNRHFKITLSPVVLFGTSVIIGLAITIEDVTLERQLETIREDFMNMMVHELRAPLTTIKGASELLLGGKLEQAEQDKMLSFIQDSTKRMLDDIGDLLDAAKIDAGKFPIVKNKNDLNLLVTEKVDSFLYIAKNKDINIVVKQDPSLPSFEFDRERVEQVLNNLLSNSVKFTHRGGLIEIEIEKKGNVVQIKVKDNGMGISKEKQGGLFVKYSQMPGQNGRQGTGLGLYISKGIVESHGGKIWLESDDGRGTTVYFTLPIVHSHDHSFETLKDPSLSDQSPLAAKVLN